MKPLKCTEIVEVVKGKLLSGKDNTIFSGISTDSRNIKEGDLFVPLKGERFDGHDYVRVFASKGALGAIVEKDFKSG